MLTHEPHATVLCVGLVPPASVEGTQFVHARSSRQAIELLRVMRVDLVVSGASLPDTSPWLFAQKLKQGWPWQKWVLVSSGALSARDELTARTLGVLAVFDDTGHWDQISEVARAIFDSAAREARQPAPTLVLPAGRHRGRVVQPSANAM